MSMFYELMMRKKGIPERYQEVEYLKSSGTQWIDTGILANDETGMQVDVQWLNDNDTVCIGSRVDSANTRFMLGMAQSGFYFGWNELGSSRPTKNLDRNVLSMNYFNDKKAYINTTLVNEISTDLATQNTNICLFACGYSPTPYLNSSVKIYNAKITKGNSVIRNFIPVYDTETQKYGMWESVQRKFYGNDGTGDFTGSIVGYTVVGSPTISDGVVSGFSSSNYLSLPSISANSYSKIEIHTKIKLNNIAKGNIITTNDSRYQGIYIRSSLQIGSYLQLGSEGYPLIYNTSLIANQYYIIDFIIDTENLYTQLIVNGTKLSSTITATNIRELLYLIGYGVNGGLDGEIDLKETYIKKDNKLWFNGQQA